jgi:hypothetical protein
VSRVNMKIQRIWKLGNPLTSGAEEVGQRHPSSQGIHCQYHPIGLAWSIDSSGE